MEAQLKAFLESLRREHDYSHNTIAAYRNDLGQFVKFLAKDTRVGQWSDVTESVIEAYVESMGQRNYAASSVARKVAALKSFFHYLFAHNAIATNPAADIESPKVEKRLPKTLSMDDVDRLLEAPTKKNTPKAMRDSALLALLYATGMRVTELVTLPVSGVHLQDGYLICPGRDGDESRELPFDEETADILRRYLESGRPNLLKDREEEALFLNHRGQRLTRQGLWLIIKTYARQAKLGSKVTPHTLRHSFVSHKLKKGAELQEIQELLGHANISTTQIYAQLSEKNNGDGSSEE